MNVQAVGVFHMNGWIQNFINDLEHKNIIFQPEKFNWGPEEGHIQLKQQMLTLNMQTVSNEQTYNSWSELGKD